MRSTAAAPSLASSSSSDVASGGNAFLHAPSPVRMGAPTFPLKPTVQSNQVYFPIVIVLKATDSIIATGTVFNERKFLRGLGCVGHIEDIAVDKTQQGKKLGLRIIQALTGISESLGCYKTILNCSDANIREFGPLIEWFIACCLLLQIAFYEKCGFVKKENEMVKYPFFFFRCLFIDRLSRPSTLLENVRKLLCLLVFEFRPRCGKWDFLSIDEFVCCI
jgi:GNAT superfamily N-acetyltransferase